MTAAMLHGEGTIAVEIQFDGVSWTDVTADVMYDAKLNITQGRSDETSQAQPAGLTFALLNTTGNYTPYTPSSIYFPNVRRNTPVRVRFDPGSGFKQIYFGYLVGMTPAWDTSAKKATVNVVAAGTLRRLTQGKSPLASALYRAITASQPTAYWPMEDPAGSTQAASAFAGVGPMVKQPGTVGIPVFGGAGPGGSASAIDFTNTGTGASGLAILLPPPPSATSWRFEMSILFPLAEPWGSVPVGFFLLGGISDIGLQMSNTGTIVHTEFSDGATTPRNDATGGNLNDGQWHRIRFDVAKSGADTTYNFRIDGVSVLSLTLTGVAFGQPWQMSVGGSVGSLMSAGSRVAACHAALWQPYASPVTVDTVAANSGFTGETADARIIRLCAEQGVPVTITGGPGMPMGPQAIAAFVDVLRDCETADGGVLYDGFTTGLGYICRSSRYNQAAAITADMAAGQVAPPFAPVDDDQRNRNDVTVSRTAGGTARAVDVTGPLGTNAIGVYDTSLTANTATTDPLLHIAEWNLGLGTVPGLRYPTLQFDLVAATALIPSWLNAGTISFRTDVTNVTSKAIQHPPGTVSVIVEGYTMVLDLASWKITANCSPFAPWRVFTVQDSVLGRIDTGGSALLAPVTNVATSLPVVSGQPWTTAAGDFPFDINVGGDKCTVSAIAASGTALSRVGAFLDKTALGAADFTGALANWTSITGITLPVTRWYQAQGDFSIGATSLAQMVSAGIKVCLTLRPDYVTVNPAHITAIDSMLASLKASGAVVNVTLWHEPFFSGLTPAQFVSVVRYYGPTVRKYYPLWVVFSGSDADVSIGYYPGDSYCDGVAVDAYALSGQTQVLNAQSIADAGGKPLAVWEFNGGADLGSPLAFQGQTQAFVTGHFQFLQNLFTARLAAGKPNGDLLFFNSGTSNFLTTSLSAKGGFEGGIGNWVTAGGCTIAANAVQHNSGSGSLALTATSAANMLASQTPVALVNLTANALPCVAGQIVMASAWFKAATVARQCQAAVFFYDNTGAALGSAFGSGATNNTTTWTRVDTTATAPASTAFAVLRVQVVTPAAAGEVHWVDDTQIGILPASNDLDSAIQYPWDYRIALMSTMQTALDGTSFPQTMTVTRGVGGVAIAHDVGDPVSLWQPAVLAL